MKIIEIEFDIRNKSLDLSVLMFGYYIYTSRYFTQCQAVPTIAFNNLSRMIVYLKKNKLAYIIMVLGNNNMLDGNH